LYVKNFFDELKIKTEQFLEMDLEACFAQGSLRIKAS
jgi:hypothetical protein